MRLGITTEGSTEDSSRREQTNRVKRVSHLGWEQAEGVREKGAEEDICG